MKTAYICSPYRADNRAQLYRNIEYARELTKLAIDVGLAPIAPHLYMTQCLEEDKPEEREAGMAAGLTLLKRCDCLIVGNKYGISEGMSTEIAEAEEEAIKVVEANWIENRKNKLCEEYAKQNHCKFCRGSRMHTCTRYSCQKPYKEAYEYAKKQFRHLFPNQILSTYWENK